MKSIIGKVKKFNGRGRKLGFPTANLNIHRPVPQGVYIGQVKIKNKSYKSLIFIGSPKTFDDPQERLEVFIPDFKKNLYNQYISVTLLAKLRNNKKFTTKEELIAQIKKDIQDLRSKI